MIPLDTLDRILELGSLGKLKVNTDGDNPFIVTPAGTAIHDLSEYFPPSNIRRDVKLIDAGSFSDYVNRFKSVETLIFAAITERSCTLKAILDYHEAAPELTANRCDHVATYTTEETPEWKAWMGANRKAMGQVEFATWLEDNIKLFVSPSGAELLELVQTLVGKSDVRFVSGIRLKDGASRLNYEEDVMLKGQPSTSSDAVELPTTLSVGVAPFLGAPKYKVDARLKYRIEGRKLSLWFETISPHIVIRECVDAIVKQVEESTKIKALLGNT